ncbi:hypothetical protein ACET3Z_007314 [Daucus carota]
MDNGRKRIGLGEVSPSSVRTDGACSPVTLMLKKEVQDICRQMGSDCLCRATIYSRDIVWNALDGIKKAGTFEVFKATNFNVIVETEDQVEVSFSRPWDPSLLGKLAPINIDKRFLLLRGSSGFYTCAIYEHLGSEEWPGFSIGESRITFKLRKHKKFL